MLPFSSRRVAGVVVLLFLGMTSLFGENVRAQNNHFTDRSFVASPEVLGMGDAGVALPGAERGFFYNPAHLPRVASHFTVFGLQGSVTPTLDDHVQFFNQQVSPAVESGADRSSEAVADLQQSASSLGRRPSRGAGAVLLPSFVYSPGALGVGAGLYAKTAVNYRVDGGRAGRPSSWMLSRTDLMALASLGLDLRVIGLPSLSVGLTGTQTRRFLAFENQPLGPNRRETAVQLVGGTTQLDAGVTYTPAWFSGLPGTLRMGGAVYDVLEGGYGYVSGGSGRLPFLEQNEDWSEASTPDSDRDEVQRARRLFALRSSYRVGVAYQLPTLFFLENLGFAADYQGYRSGSQRPLARVHLGARAGLTEMLEVRAGLSSGYPTAGVGLEWRAVHVDYSFHGVEEGRRAGRVGTYVHTVRLLFRLD